MKYKELFRTDLFGNKQEIILDLECYSGKFRFNKLISNGEKYTLLKTATTPMKTDYYTGEVLDLNNNSAKVIVKLGDRSVNVENVRILDKDVDKKDRVILSEHVNIDGNIEWVASKSPIKTGDLNFITISLEDAFGNCTYKKRIDVVTGESKEELNDTN